MADVKLTYIPGSRSLRVRWLLEELGVPYQLERVTFSRGHLKTPEYLAKNPLGLVPTLEDGDSVLFESGAIFEHVLERHDPDGRLLPRTNPARATVRSWMHWAEGSASPPLGIYLRHAVMLPEDRRNTAAADEAKKRLVQVFEAISRQLERQDYLAGREFTAADVMLGLTLLLCKQVALLGPDMPSLLAYYERLAAREAFVRANAD